MNINTLLSQFDFKINIRGLDVVLNNHSYINLDCFSCKFCLKMNILENRNLSVVCKNTNLPSCFDTNLNKNNADW